VLNSKLVSYHRNEFRVGGLRLAYIDRVAEQVADGVDVAKSLCSKGWGDLENKTNCYIKFEFFRYLSGSTSKIGWLTCVPN